MCTMRLGRNVLAVLCFGIRTEIHEISLQIDLDDEAEDDFYSEFKDGKKKLAADDDADSGEESEEFEEGMDGDFSDGDDDVPMEDDDNSEYDAEESGEDDGDAFEDEEFGGKPRGPLTTSLTHRVLVEHASHTFSVETIHKKRII